MYGNTCEPEFDPDHPEEYMDHRHCTDGHAKPVTYPKRDESNDTPRKKPNVK